jgi:nucleoside-diphosphate-sugar epimerase
MLRGYAAFAPLRAVTLKLFDTYGPADRRRKLLTLLLEASERGERLAMSPGEQRIDLLHVDDAVAAFAAAAARLDELADGTHECYALGSGRRPTLKELVALLAGAGAPVEVEWGGRPYREREVMEPWSGGQPLPGWQPRIRLEDGLAALVSGRRGSGD